MKKKSTNKLLILWYSHPRVAIALSLIVVNLIVILLFSIILSIVSGNPFFEELAYIFTYTMSADGIYDFVNNADDVACFVIKIVLTVLQMIIFSGALIGFTTDILQSTIDNQLNNVGKLRLKNHFVFLNWSSIGANLIYDLSFLEGKKNVVILAENERDDVINSIQNIFAENDRKMTGINLFVKKGNPGSLKHLDDISIKNAQYVGVLLKTLEEGSEKEISNNDLASFKSLMSILHIGVSSNIVIEVEDNDTVQKIEKFIRETNPDILNRVSIFAHNSIIGHVLGRAITNPIYSYLFHDLLSYDGIEFYGIETMDIEEALYKYNDCIPIINYDDDSVIDEFGEKHPDQLYILSDDSKSLGIRKEPKSYVKPLNYKEIINKEDFTLFIISDYDRASFVVDEINMYNEMNHKTINYKIFSYSTDIDNFVEEINNTNGEKKILLLSSENNTEADQDADIFITLLSLKTNTKFDSNIPIFAEIVNPSNLIPMKNLGVVSVIVSNKIISLYMLQLLTHPGSRRFFRDLIVANGESENGDIDLDIIKAGEVLEFENDNLVFSCQSELIQSFYIASKKTRMLIAIKYAKNDISDIFFFGDRMDEENEIVISPEDELITVVY